MADTAINDGLLILVHPDSCLGSADFNLGQDLAVASRDVLADRLNRWQGGVLVLNGDFVDEFDRHPALAAAIRDALRRARAAGRISMTVAAADPSQVKVMRRLAPIIAPRSSRIVVSGAWFHDDGRSGCVDSVHDVLRDIGYRHVDVDDSAFRLEMEPEPADDPICGRVAAGL